MRRNWLLSKRSHHKTRAGSYITIPERKGYAASRSGFFKFPNRTHFPNVLYRIANVFPPNRIRCLPGRFFVFPNRVYCGGFGFSVFFPNWNFRVPNRNFFLIGHACFPIAMSVFRIGYAAFRVAIADFRLVNRIMNRIRVRSVPIRKLHSESEIV